MAFTIGSGTFTNGSATVTGVTLTSGTLAYFASGTRMVVGVNPVIQEVEAIAAPTVSTITLRSAWTGTGGTYSFLANQTSEGLRDAVQAIRTNNASLQSFIDSIDTAATADSVAQRTSDGSVNAVNVYASGNVGIGSTSPSGKLEVNTGSSAAFFTRAAGDNGVASPAFAITSASTDIRIGSSGDLSFRVGAVGTAANAQAERLRIDSSGNVGIGRLPSLKFDVLSGVNNTDIARFTGTQTAKGLVVSTYASNGNDGGARLSSTDSLAISTNSAERLRIDSLGNVGIGVSSPAAPLHVQKSGTAAIALVATGAVGFDISSIAASSEVKFEKSGNDGPITFYNDGAERMRIDASGNVLVGKTSANSNLQGIELRTGFAVFTSTSNVALISNRKTSDGAIHEFQKDGTTVGSIGSYTSGLLYTTAGLSVPTGVVYGDDLFVPCGANGAARDNIIPLGNSGRRWSVVYAGTGSINTSDAREKTPVDEFTADELNAAKQLSKEIGTYKFLSAVAKKGDDARKHIGMTVQRAIEIMEANNLDPFAYGFICYDAWEEKTVEHPAVEAKDAEYDEDGNLISEAVEAKDAYTEVVQEAGDRYSFRPDEMLFFIARGLEARIEALEG